MTRKRYVKLLMGHGYSRNEANRCAQEIADDGGNYQEEYDDQVEAWRILEGLNVDKMREAMQRLTQAVVETFPKFVEALTRTVEAINAGLSAFGEAYRAAMDKEKEPEG